MEGNISHTAITSFGYGTLPLKKGPNHPGPIFSTLFIFSYTFLLLNNYSFRDPNYIRPVLLFSRPHFATPIRDSNFATHIRDSNFATPIRDPHSRPTFATPLATHIRDSTRDSY